MGAQQRILFRVLTTILPHDIASICSHVTAEERDGRNGFRLLWNFGADLIGIFNRSCGVGEPLWPLDDNVYTLQSHVRLHGSLLRQRGLPLTERELSLKFLSLIEHNKYANLAQTLEADIMNSPTDILDNNFLMELGMEHLARTLTHRSLRAARRSAHASATTRRLVVNDDLNVRDRRNATQHPVGTCRAERRQYDNERCYANTRPPDMRAMEWRQRNERYDGKCEACGKYGHRASRCNFLGSYLCLLGYLKGKNKPERDECLTNWTNRNKKWLEPAVQQQGRDYRRRSGGGRGGQQRPRDRRPRHKALALRYMGELSDVYCHKTLTPWQTAWIGDFLPIAPGMTSLV